MRQPITLKIKFKSGSLDQFIERYSVDVSRGGIFIRTKEPLQVGTILKFEFQLQDASALISGEGTVVWIREHDPNRSGVAPGMGVRFDKLATTSSSVLDQILAEKARRGEGSVESRFDAGVRANQSASGTVGASAGRRGPVPDYDPSDAKSLTPLPNPVPGLDGAEEFGQESTRVMQDDVVQRLKERTRENERARDEEAFSDEPTRARMAGEIEHLVKQTTGPISLGDEHLDRTNVDERPRAKPVISSSPPPIPAKGNQPAPLPPPPGPSSPPSSISIPDLPAASQSAPTLSAAGSAAGLGDDDPTGALPLPLISDPSETTIRDERPPVRKKGSPLPAVLGVGVIAAAAIGYLVFAGNGAGTKPAGDEPSKVAKDNPPEAKKDPQAAKNEEPTGDEKGPPPEAKPGEKDDKPEVAAKKEDAKTEAPKGPSVEVTSEPAGAIVFVDGKQRGPTPITLADLDPKKASEVRLALKGYHEFKTSVSAKAGVKVQAKLVANEKVVEVTSTPPGADVLVDGKRVGRTPYTIRKFDVVKDHEVELRHGGFVSQTRKVGAGDAWDSKPEGRDVLALALTLEAEPPKVARTVPKRPVGKKPEESGEKPVATPTEKPPETGEKPPEEKPVVDKPEKPVEKTDKPEAEKKEKPAEKSEKSEKPEKKEGETIKTPAWMKEKPAEGEAQ